HLVLEQLAKRLDQLHVHALRQAADIVVGLDGGRGRTGKGNAFYHVRIESSLSQKIGAAQLLRLFLEYFNEKPADGLALGFGVGQALQRRDEAIGSVDQNQRQV